MISTRRDAAGKLRRSQRAKSIQQIISGKKVRGLSAGIRVRRNDPGNDAFRGRAVIAIRSIEIHAGVADEEARCIGGERIPKQRGTG